MHDLPVTPLLLLAFGCAPVDADDAPADTDLPLPEAWTPPDEPGPYPVGARTLRLDDPERGPLTLEVWYPAAPAPGAVPGRYEEGILGLDGAAFRDAPVDPRGPFPVVAFSHGFGGVRFQSVFLTEHLAAHGFVVVAPDHPRTSLVDFRPDETAVSASLRPTEVRRAVDALTDPGVPGLRFDADAYAVVGHSFGGWTALAVGGGVLDLPDFEATCAGVSPPRACRFFEGQSFDGLDLSTATPDPRAAATVAITPGAWYAFGADGSGLASVRHGLVVGATLDDELPYAEHEGAYAGLGPPKAFATVVGSGHWSFTDLCALLPLADCAGEAGGYLDPARVHALARTVVLAHVRHHLLDDARDLPWLGPTDDLSWEAEP